MNEPQPPKIVQDENWESVELPFNIGSGRTVFSEASCRLKLFRLKQDHSLVGRVWFGTPGEGPPGHVHGGATAYVLDEAMGSVAWMNDFPSVAAKLEFTYFTMTPLHLDLQIEARIETVTPKLIEIVSELKLPNGELCVRGKGYFARLSRSKIKALNAQHRDLNRVIDDSYWKWAAD